MASYAYTFTSGDTVTPTKLNSARTVSDIVNADVSATAAIAHTKLASITAGQVLLGNGSNVPTATALSGDVTVNSSGVTAIGSGVIVDADINASAAIDLSKLATGALPTAITVASANLVDGTIVNADINASAAIADTKLATISTAGKVSNSATTATNANTANAIVARDASGNFSAGTITANLTGTASAIADGSVSTAKIVDANVTNAKLASDIDASKLTTGTLPIARIADDAVTNDKLSLTANAGEIKKALNADNSPPIYACRAWVQFVGTTGSTVDGEFRCTINGSGNVTKVVRGSGGIFTVYLTTAMPTANYAATMSYQIASGVNTGRLSTTTTSQITLVFSDNNGAQNPSHCSVAVFG